MAEIVSTKKFIADVAPARTARAVLSQHSNGTVHAIVLYFDGKRVMRGAGGVGGTTLLNEKFEGSSEDEVLLAIQEWAINKFGAFENLRPDLA